MITRALRPLLVLLLLLLSFGCTEEVTVTPHDGPCKDLPDAAQRKACYESLGVRLTVIHTSDWHSRLLPYDLDVLATDERLGLLQANEPFGGVARAAHIIKRERANADRAIHIDSGDCFQGAPIFNEFMGEAEIAAMNEVAVDAFVIGNHEFDNGVLNLDDKLSRAQYSVLAANYLWRPTEGEELAPLSNIAKPYTVINADGVTIGVIGMANFSSLSSISYGDSGLGITVLESKQTVQEYVNLLRPYVNVIVVLTHLGLGEDEEVIRNTRGIDMVFGGHLHVVLNPPKLIPDLDGRMVPLVHSGAFLKYVGRFDGVFTTDPDEPWNLELVSHDYKAIPVDSTIPEDPALTHVMAPYELELSRRIDLRKVIGYTSQPLRRFGTGGGDSPLGNFLADAMLLRERVEADISATNSLGIRADINRGEITVDQMYNVFPFPNTITTMTLSGNEVQELLDFNTYRSAGRGCATQLQVAGVAYELDCDTVNKEVTRVLDAGQVYEFEYRDPSTKFAKNIRIIRGLCANISECAPGISVCTDNRTVPCEFPTGSTDVGSCRCRELLQPGFFYKFATNNYMARGGSGFTSLKFNTTQSDTGVDLREAVTEAIEQQATCQERCEKSMGGAFSAETMGNCDVLQACRQDLGAYENRWCDGLHEFSERDECAANAGASRCLSMSGRSEQEYCMLTSYHECDGKFYTDDVAACKAAAEAEQGLCAAKAQFSPKELCIRQAASQCDDSYSSLSDYDACLEFTRRKAELLCPGLPCPEAEGDNRQRPIRPRNDAVGTGAGFVAIDPVVSMEALQAEGYDACY